MQSIVKNLSQMKKIKILNFFLIALCLFLFYVLYLFSFGYQTVTEQINSTTVTLFGDTPDYTDLNYDGPYIFYHDDVAEIITIEKSKPKQDYGKINRKFIGLQDLYSTKFKSHIIDADGNSENYVTFQLTENYLIPKSVNVLLPNQKIFCISDLEGNFEIFRSFLLNNKIIDKDNKWIFGNNFLVINGDTFDRGYNVLPILWLLYELEREGGNIIFVIGNHEQLNLTGNKKYLSRKYKALELIINKGYINYYNENTELGKWLATKKSVYKIGTFLFLHGGISPKVFNKKLSLDSLNNIITKNIRLPKELRKDTIVSNLLLDNYEGVLWYRGYFKNQDNYNRSTQADIDSICNYFGVEKIIVGHTIVDEIKTYYNGKIINIDVTRNDDIGKNRPSALLIENNKFYAIDELGRNFLIK
ncbi:hypothetical protein FACS189426_02930 [Bacteroidia bacterium]|nr:hypothetical protein FACS189426_02930 [Bacteroidia bacterium]